jgi:hypothetical protein
VQWPAGEASFRSFPAGQTPRPDQSTFPSFSIGRGARIEQLIGKLKRFKRVAMRCEKTTQNYAAFVSMAFVFILIKSVHTA